MRIDLECTRGDTTEWDLTVVKNDLPVDLTGGKLWMTARRTRGGTLVFQRTSEVGAGITIAPDQVADKGEAVIKLAVDSTSALASEEVTLYYDIQAKVGSDIWTVSYGDLVVTPDATLEIV